jgi:hypothetical protein
MNSGCWRAFRLHSFKQSVFCLQRLRLNPCLSGVGIVSITFAIEGTFMNQSQKLFGIIFPTLILLCGLTANAQQTATATLTDNLVTQISVISGGSG